MRLRGKQARGERRRRLGHVSDLPTQLVQSGLGETDPAVATGPFALMDGCPSTPMGANIGIISDKGFTALYGSCEAVELEVESLMNLVNALYTDMTNLQLAVVYLVCNGAGSGDNFEAEGPNDEPLFFGQRTCTRWDDNSGSGGLQSSKSKNEDGSEGELIQGVNDVDIVLSSFSKWVGMYAPTSAGKRIASWQLLTDCFPTGGLTGLAYTNAACWVGSTKYRMKKNGKCKSAKDGGPCAYKYVGKRGKRASPVVADGTCDEESWLPCQAAVGLSSAGTSLFRTLAHEIGHNFGSSHTFDAGGLMSYRTDIPFFDTHQICTNLMQIIDGGQTQRGAETNCDADGETAASTTRNLRGCAATASCSPAGVRRRQHERRRRLLGRVQVECGFACEEVGRAAHLLDVHAPLRRRRRSGNSARSATTRASATAAASRRRATPVLGRCDADCRSRPTAGRAPRRTAPPPASASAPSALRGSRSSTRSPASSSTRWRAR